MPSLPTVLRETVRSRGRVALLAAFAATAVLFALHLPPPGGNPGFQVAPSVPKRAAEPLYRESFVTHGETREVHAASAAALPGGGVIAFWYGGTREGAGDVSIYSARLDAGSDEWSAPRLMVDRAGAARDLDRYIRKLGNPVVFRPRGDTLWLFYVTVSVGGWGGSSLNLMISGDGGVSWQRGRRLVTSPFFNLSTLVKGGMISYADGSFGLPVYHEFIGKFSELLHLDAEGNLLRKQRLSHGGVSLQPVIVPASAARAAAFLRYAGAPPNRMLWLHTEDGGTTWTAPVKSALPNPNSAVSALRVDDGDWLLAFNDSEEERDNLTLARSRNEGMDWQRLTRIEAISRDANPDGARYSYPWLLAGEDGLIHVLYTWHKQRIKHAVFNRAWLEREAASAGMPP